ncbi:MAG: hypothetical protein HY811_05435 [Planctomycetes bacterium]|nr:hypothetical protein [Planctomycetota bacterium]
MKELRKCKEDKCENPLPNGNNPISWTARNMGYCRYCYLSYYPKRKRSNRAPLRWGSRPLLSTSQRNKMYKGVFEKTGRRLWSYSFYREWMAIWEEKLATPRRSDIRERKEG